MLFLLDTWYDTYYSSSHPVHVALTKSIATLPPPPRPLNPQLKIPLSGDVLDRTVLSLAAGSGSKDTFMAVLAALEEELTEDQVGGNQ